MSISTSSNWLIDNINQVKGYLHVTSEKILSVSYQITQQQQRYNTLQESKVKESLSKANPVLQVISLVEVVVEVELE